MQEALNENEMGRCVVGLGIGSVVELCGDWECGGIGNVVGLCGDWECGGVDWEYGGVV